MSVDAQPQLKQDYHKIYHELDELVQNYHDNFENCFQFRQNALIQELEERSKVLNYEIGRLEIRTSEAAISLLIGKRKQEKEAERLKLEMTWRELTDKLKKLEEEQKKLINENAQSKFDIENLQSKISELSQQNQKLSIQIETIQKNSTPNPFLTQPTKKSYSSPYKSQMCPKIHQERTTTRPKTKTKNINQRLQQVRAMKQIPTNVLMEFLGRRDIKARIFQILYQ